jgi:hypothetical protein
MESALTDFGLKLDTHFQIYSCDEIGDQFKLLHDIGANQPVVMNENRD